MKKQQNSNDYNVNQGTPPAGNDPENYVISKNLDDHQGYAPGTLVKKVEELPENYFIVLDNKGNKWQVGEEEITPAGNDLPEQLFVVCECDIAPDPAAPPYFTPDTTYFGAKFREEEAPQIAQEIVRRYNDFPALQKRLHDSMANETLQEALREREQEQNEELIKMLQRFVKVAKMHPGIDHHTVTSMAKTLLSKYSK